MDVRGTQAMKYVYAAMVLHSSGQKISEENVKKILTAAGVTVDEARIKALVAAISEVNIDEAIKAASVVTVQAGPAPSAGEAKKEEKKPAEEEKKKEEEALAGLGALFG
jgi:large subunit ribosomal protein L12